MCNRNDSLSAAIDPSSELHERLDEVYAEEFPESKASRIWGRIVQPNLQIELGLA